MKNKKSRDLSAELEAGVVWRGTCCSIHPLFHVHIFFPIHVGEWGASVVYLAAHLEINTFLTGGAFESDFCATYHQFHYEKIRQTKKKGILYSGVASSKFWEWPNILTWSEQQDLVWDTASRNTKQQDIL